MKLHNKLGIALLLGITLGAALHPYADAPGLVAFNTHVLRPIGQIFLRTIFMIVVPMVFSALVIGVYQLGRGRDLSGVAGRTLGFTVLLSATSVAIGVALVNLLQPGRGVQLAAAGVPTPGVQAIEANAAAVKPLSDVFIELIPRNPFESAVRALDGEMLPLMVFAVIFGVAVSHLRPRQGEDEVLLVSVFEQIFDACMRIVHFAMLLAPFAVFAIVFNTAFTFGTGILPRCSLRHHGRCRPARPAVCRVLRASVDGGAPVAGRILPQVP